MALSHFSFDLQAIREGNALSVVSRTTSGRSNMWGSSLSCFVDNPVIGTVHVKQENVAGKKYPGEQSRAVFIEAETLVTLSG